MAPSRPRPSIDSGWLLVDKPIGLSSSKVLSMVRYHANIKKAGHMGCLDPMASGLLPIGFGEATKYAQYLLNEDKAYTCTIQLGQATHSGDADGEIIGTAEVPHYEPTHWLKVIEGFIGKQTQIPPMVSALKVEGKTLHKLARQGITVPRQPRDIEIRNLALLGYCEATQQLRLSVDCSKGTYIRVLGEDIAKALGTLGHLTQLRRTRVGEWDAMVSFDWIKSASIEAISQQLIPIEQPFGHVPDIALSESDVIRLQQGQRIACSPANQGLVQVKGPAAWIGLGQINEFGTLKPVRLLKTPQFQKAAPAAV